MAEYGIPYMGSKSKIANDIIDILPRGKRFVDLFGGGFAMTHAAIMHNKWDKYYYNELNPLLPPLIKKAINGDFNYNKFLPKWISREEFNEKKDTDGYIKYIWSFGNNGEAYLFGNSIEPVKKAMHNAVVFGDMTEALKYEPELINIKGNNPHDRRLSWGRIMKQRKHQRNEVELEQLERLEQLEQLQRLERLEQLELHCGSYLDYEYQDGDVVYCDPPYENTAEYSCGAFDSKQFYDWVYSRPYTVYFSSYDISDKRFYVVFEKTKISLLKGSHDARLKKIERVYCNRPIKTMLF